MKMPILFETKKQAEKEAYKFDCEGAHQIGDKWMPCSMHKLNHLQKGANYPYFISTVNIIL